MHADLVSHGVLVGVIEDVSEVELVVLVHGEVESKHGGAVAAQASILSQHAALHHHAHGEVGTVKD